MLRTGAKHDKSDLEKVFFCSIGWFVIFLNKGVMPSSPVIGDDYKSINGILHPIQSDTSYHRVILILTEHWSAEICQLFLLHSVAYMIEKGIKHTVGLPKY